MREETIVTTDGFDRTCGIPELQDIENGMRPEPRYLSSRGIKEARSGQLVRLRTRCFDSTGKDLVREYPRHVAAALLLYSHCYDLEGEDPDRDTTIADTIGSLLTEFGIDEDTRASYWIIEEVLPPAVAAKTAE
jgi:hypothetical protein